MFCFVFCFVFCFFISAGTNDGFPLPDVSLTGARGPPDAHDVFYGLQTRDNVAQRVEFSPPWKQRTCSFSYPPVTDASSDPFVILCLRFPKVLTLEREFIVLL